MGRSQTDLNNAEEEQLQPLNTLKEDNIALEKRKLTKRKLIKDLVIFSLSFLMCFGPANAISNLQSSLHGSLGVLALSVSSFSFLGVCLFLPPILNKYFNYKWPLVASQFCVALLTAANLYPRYKLVISLINLIKKMFIFSKIFFK
jgi:hypothetical protein